ncbi:MAG TPA: signal peptidase I [Thermoanaerobaculia bacterium]|nr:signal peptidase I [Thermoanaerobaculia bacterium]
MNWLAAFAAAGMLRMFAIPTGAMEPGIPIGSRVAVEETQNVHTGDIIVFRYPLDPKVVHVKRIVAGPEDTVAIRDKRLRVNGREIRELYVMHDDPKVYPDQPSLPEPYRSRDQYGPYRVPADSWFVLGDNRDKSSDSRFWGVVPRENVIGRVVYVIKP